MHNKITKSLAAVLSLTATSTLLPVMANDLQVKSVESVGVNKAQQLKSLRYIDTLNADSSNQLIVKFGAATAMSQALGLETATSSTSEQQRKTIADTQALRTQFVAKLSNDLGHDFTLGRSLGNDFFVVTLTDGAMANDQIEILKSAVAMESGIVSAEVDMMMQIVYTPNDTYFANQWHYYESTGGINLPDTLDLASGAGTVVAVLDTGITAHPDLDGNVVAGYDFISSTSISNDGNGRDNNPADTGDYNGWFECGFGNPYPSDSSWHGTHVAGTIAAVSNNGSGVAGVAPDAKIQPVRVLGRCGGQTSDIIDGIRWAAGLSVSGVPSNPTPADVINMSLGGGSACSSAYQAAINEAVSAGTTVVVAAGNSDANAANFSPASCNNVVTVASTTRAGGRAYYSNFGSVVDVAAPGGETNSVATDGVLSTLNSGTQAPAAPNYAYYQGTSMAAPHVAGVVALMKSVNSNLTPAQIEQILENSARSFPATCNGCGSGIVDANQAVLDAIN